MLYELIKDKSWKKILENEFNKDYIKEIEFFLKSEEKNWKIIFPKKENIFNALNKTDLKNLKVVILWQDPYHNDNEAHWLSFSVPEWIKIPPSLRNIFKELNSDINKDIPKSWNLEYLAEQWVLLLNAFLTVEKNKPASHSKIGWETLTNKIIETISEETENTIFLLWWAFAQTKKKLIDTSKHYVLETTHPSPFSSYRWFLWSKHFSKTNDILKKLKKEEIQW